MRVQDKALLKIVMSLDGFSQLCQEKGISTYAAEMYTGSNKGIKLGSQTDIITQ